MKFVPRLYQSMAIDFLLKHQRCALYAGMGLGKTVSTLMAVRHLQEWPCPRPRSAPRGAVHVAG